LAFDIYRFLDSLKDSIDTILIVLGTFFIFLTVPSLTPDNQWFSALSLLTGVILVVAGVALHFESFKWKVPSLEGFGAIIIYASFVLMAVAVISAFFALPGGIAAIPAHESSYRAVDEHGSPFGFITPGPPSGYFLVVLLDRPNAWFATPLMITGIGLLVFGFLLKFARDIF